MTQNKRQININGTVVFKKNYDVINSDLRFIINEGGSRSSKTWSLCQLFIIYLLNNPGKQASIVRKSFPSLRSSVMKDFFEVLKEYGLYSKENHNKTEHTYTFSNGSSVDFFSVDDEQKIRGRKRDLLWANESNELNYEDFTQLNLRTTDKIFLDYNPSETNSWIYELDPDSSIIIKSTYKDNPFISKEIINQIENYKLTDPELYEIFGMGNRITPRQNVYSNWNFIDSRPAKFKDFVYGMDFGWSHPAALIKIWFCENELYLEELIYETNHTPADIIKLMDKLQVNKSTIILADYSRPEAIAEIQMAGYYIQGADKSVKDGIMDVKNYIVNVSNDSKNIKKEYQNYKWKKAGDRILDEPIKLWDDAMDSIRYGVKYIKKTYTNAGPTQFYTFDI